MRSLAVSETFTAIGNEAFSLISKIVTQDFPNNAECFVTSLQATLLDRFSLYFLFLPYSSHTGDQPQFLTIHRRHVDSAIPLLRAFTNVKACLADATVDEDITNEFADAHFAVRKKDKQKQKRSRRSNNVAPDDLKIIADSGESIPATQEEVVPMISSVLQRQKSILQVGRKGSRSDLADHPAVPSRIISTRSENPDSPLRSETCISLGTSQSQMPQLLLNDQSR